MTELTQLTSNQGEGNTNLPPKHADNTRTQSKKWVLTLNNYTKDEFNSLNSYFEKNCTKYILADEVGQSGTNHIQGCVHFNVRKAISTLKGINKRIHWETQRGNDKQAFDYCRKDGCILSQKGLPRPLKPVTIYGWQQELWDRIQSDADDRTIIWYWSSEGERGKSTFVKYCIDHLGDKLAYTTSCKGADLMTAINETTEYVICDFPRDSSPFKYFPTCVAESIKNGIITDGKLKKTMRTFRINSPWFIVFANEPPNETKMSRDRWDITDIDQAMSFYYNEVRVLASDEAREPSSS